MTTNAEIFTPQYTDFSGPGSTLDASAPYRHFLEDFISSRPVNNRSGGIESVLDLGCGDMTVMSAVDRGGALYFGADVIQERVDRNRTKYPRMHFECKDIQTWIYPRTDLIVCKDVIQHWSSAEIFAWLIHLSKQTFRYALITNCNYGPTVNTDIETGGWRAVDLTRPPFSLALEVVFSWSQAEWSKDVVLIHGA